jgi:hypothetical protein
MLYSICIPVILSLFKSKLKLDLDPSIMITRFGSLSSNTSIGSAIWKVNFGCSKVEYFAKQVAKHAKRAVLFRIKIKKLAK